MLKFSTFSQLIRTGLTMKRLSPRLGADVPVVSLPMLQAASISSSRSLLDLLTDILYPAVPLHSTEFSHALKIAAADPERFFSEHRPPQVLTRPFHVDKFRIARSKEALTTLFELAATSYLQVEDHNLLAENVFSLATLAHYLNTKLKNPPPPKHKRPSSLASSSTSSSSLDSSSTSVVEPSSSSSSSSSAFSSSASLTQPPSIPPSATPLPPSRFSPAPYRSAYLPKLHMNTLLRALMKDVPLLSAHHVILTLNALARGDSFWAPPFTLVPLVEHFLRRCDASLLPLHFIQLFESLARLSFSPPIPLLIPLAGHALHPAMLARYARTDLAFLLWSMAQLNYRPTVAQLRALWERLAELLPGFSPLGVASLLSSLHLLDVPPPAPVLAAIRAHIADNLREYPVRCVHRIVHAVAMLKLQPLYDVLPALLDRLLADFPAVSLNHFRQLVASLQTLPDFSPYEPFILSFAAVMHEHPASVTHTDLLIQVIKLLTDFLSTHNNLSPAFQADLTFQLQKLSKDLLQAR